MPVSRTWRTLGVLPMFAFVPLCIVDAARAQHPPLARPWRCRARSPRASPTCLRPSCSDASQLTSPRLRKISRPLCQCERDRATVWLMATTRVPVASSTEGLRLDAVLQFFDLQRGAIGTLPSAG